MVAPATGLGDEPRCEVELTEVRTGGQDWWTLGFEATGCGAEATYGDCSTTDEELRGRA